MPTPFQTSRLTYRAIEDTDEPFIHSLQLHPPSFATSNATLLRPQSTRDTKTGYFKYLTSEKALLATIIELSPNTTTLPTPTTIQIGAISLRAPPPDHAHHRETALTIDIAAEHQGQGYGSEAIAWALRWAFRVAGLHRVTVEAVGYNTDAVRLYRRLGFVVEGRKREAVWFEGRWYDFVILGMLEGEWRGTRDGEGGEIGTGTGTGSS
ncbi:acyl-CoA N-acyltransferase [Aspergillus heteromorphus CBS 117.55]|uniref:Acyl-CoA N-acyltransferase n=1 Tax=Aspergillus heteromorphus CBS 117.55 TaxID=1448321 RepID=A0A317X028_9EURO|nr:acyl-CoA N-acyltransferase [Aspergillus heteromorphus CBS 117.55]PWY90907.1 acyl-CoA N-acyltransferase [Aspergillus heteromorphus CBS 117.55]